MEYLVNLKNWWIENPSVWFGSTETDDIIIANKFYYIEDLINSPDFDIGQLVGSVDKSIGYIIFQDQISRHIKRAKNLQDSFVLDKLSEEFIQFVKDFYHSNKSKLSGYDFCFVLLPLRHTRQFKHHTFVIKETWEKISGLKSHSDDLTKLAELAESTDELVKIYKNYLKASYERAVKGPVNLFVLNEPDILIKHCFKSINLKFKDILDTNCHNYESTDDGFGRLDGLGSLDRLDGLEAERDSNKFKNILESVEKLNRHWVDNKVILSISGGVDSMVLAYLLKLNRVDFVMIHINYANRGNICEREKELLGDLSKYFDIELYIRDIYEITRPECMEWDLRNLYEEYTKDVRFQAYLDVAEIKGWNKFTVGLGHNHDDCVENILTNISSKSKYNNLYGMEVFSEVKFEKQQYLTTNKQIHFTRPFVSISKEEIYNFAHYLKIPYLFDSTPKWSQRGMIRDIVRPALIKWNKSVIEGFDELSLTLTESLECVDLLVLGWMNRIKPFDTLDKKDMVYISKYKMSISQSINTQLSVIKITESELKPNKIFWSRLLVKMGFNSSSKNLNEVINRIRVFKQKFKLNQIEIKHLTQVQINKEAKIYFWKCLDTNIVIGFD